MKQTMNANSIIEINKEIERIVKELEKFEEDLLK